MKKYENTPENVAKWLHIVATQVNMGYTPEESGMYATQYIRAELRYKIEYPDIPVFSYPGISMG